MVRFLAGAPASEVYRASIEHEVGTELTRAKHEVGCEFTSAARECNRQTSVWHEGA
jgi:hypothetical protein